MPMKSAFGVLSLAHRWWKRTYARRSISPLRSGVPKAACLCRHAGSEPVMLAAKAARMMVLSTRYSSHREEICGAQNINE